MTPQQLTFIIRSRTCSSAMVECHVDEFEILADIKYLHLIRYSGEDNMYNLEDIISYSYIEEKKE